MTESSFLKEFLMITDIKTVSFIFVPFAMFFVVKQLEKRKVKFSTRTIIATLLGLGWGVVIQFVANFPEDPSSVTWLAEVTKWYGLFGYGFMDLLKMIVVPMVFTSILRVIINMENDNLGTLTGKSLGLLLGTTVMSAIVGIVVANVMQLGVGVNAGDLVGTAEMKEIVPLVETIRGLLPSNPVESMVNGNIVAVVIFAGFLGIAVKRFNKKYADIIKPFVDLVEAFYKIIVSVAMTVIKFMPYAVVTLLANTITARGIVSMLSVVKFIVALHISVFLVLIIHLLLVASTKLNPFKFLQNSMEALLLAFTSRSSLGTLPVTIDNLVKNQGTEEGVASFVASLGTNMGMNGCAGIYPDLMAVTIANMAGVNMDISFYAMLLVVITVSSLGIASLPGTATMAVSIVVSGVGLGEFFPLAGGILAIDPILDMGRTIINVSGATTSSVVVDNSLSKLDKKIFNENNISNKQQD